MLIFRQNLKDSLYPFSLVIIVSSRRYALDCVYSVELFTSQSINCNANPEIRLPVLNNRYLYEYLVYNMERNNDR